MNLVAGIILFYYFIRWNIFTEPHLFTFILQKREFDVDSLSKSELRMLLSILEGELEAQDLVIEALRVCHLFITETFFNLELKVLLRCSNDSNNYR